MIDRQALYQVRNVQTLLHGEQSSFYLLKVSCTYSLFDISRGQEIHQRGQSRLRLLNCHCCLLNLPNRFHGFFLLARWKTIYVIKDVCRFGNLQDSSKKRTNEHCIYTCQQKRLYFISLDLPHFCKHIILRLACTTIMQYQSVLDLHLTQRLLEILLSLMQTQRSQRDIYSGIRKRIFNSALSLTQCSVNIENYSFQNRYIVI